MLDENYKFDENWFFHYFVPTEKYNKNWLFLGVKNNINEKKKKIEYEEKIENYNLIRDVFINVLNNEYNNYNYHSCKWKNQQLLSSLIDELSGGNIYNMPLHWGGQENNVLEIDWTKLYNK